MASMNLEDLSIEDLHAYLDEALSAEEISTIEQALRDSPSLQQILRRLMQERDRGEHSVGAIWRRNRISCLSREELGNYSLGILDKEVHDYIHFHLVIVGCPYCQANLSDIENQDKESAKQVQQRRKKLFKSSAGLLSNL